MFKLSSPRLIRLRSKFYWWASIQVAKVYKLLPHSRLNSWLQGNLWVYFNAASYYNVSLYRAWRRYR